MTEPAATTNNINTKVEDLPGSILPADGVSGATVIETVAVAVLLTESVTVYRNVSIPVKPVFGV